MKKEWFFKQDDKIFGPFEAVKLKTMAQGGNIEPFTLVRKTETGKWVEAARIKGLFVPREDKTFSDDPLSHSEWDDPYEMSHKNNSSDQVIKIPKDQGKVIRSKILRWAGFCFLVFLIIIIAGLLLPLTPESNFEKGMQTLDHENLFKDANYNDAVYYFSKVIEKEPNFRGEYDTAIGCRGFAYFKLKKYQEAVDDMTVDIKIKPPLSAAIYTYRGKAYFELGKYQESIDDITNAIVLVHSDGGPDSNLELKDLYQLRGDACSAQKKFTLAVSDYKKSNMDKSPSQYDNEYKVAGRRGKLRRIALGVSAGFNTNDPFYIEPTILNKMINEIEK